MFSDKVSQDDINKYYCNMIRKYPTGIHLCGYNYNYGQSTGAENIRPTLIFGCLFPEYFFELDGAQFYATLLDRETKNAEPIREFPPETDSLILRINLNLPKKEIISQVEEYLDINLIGKETRGRYREWKYYLMVYALYKAGHRYAKICEILTSKLNLPQKERDKFTEERTIENYHKNALALINGDYKKYI